MCLDVVKRRLLALTMDVDEKMPILFKQYLRNKLTVDKNAVFTRVDNSRRTISSLSSESIAIPLRQRCLRDPSRSTENNPSIAADRSPSFIRSLETRSPVRLRDCRR